MNDDEVFDTPRRCSMNDELLLQLEADSLVLDLRLGLAEADLDGLAERLDRLETEVAELRRRRWWR
jgi:hypothetical protein